MSDLEQALDVTGIRARMQAATPGPWALDHNDPENPGIYVAADIPSRGVKHRRSGQYIRQIGIATLSEGYPWQAVRDATFIAHARTDIPALLAEVDRLRALLAEAGER